MGVRSMTVFKFVTSDEIEDLDDNPRLAFMTFVGHAERRLTEMLKTLDPRDEADREQRDELRHSFMNVVIAAAKRFEIEPFASTQVPKYTDYQKQFDHREFKADLDHYITQIALEHSIAMKQDSASILSGSKDKIRNYIHALRTCIEQANMTDSKRDSLLKKLDLFEAELEKRRTSSLAVARICFEILAIPGAMWSSSDVAHKLATNIMQTFAEAKATEQQNVVPPYSAVPRALSAPRIEANSCNRNFGKQSPQAHGPLDTSERSDALDDDIPF